MKTLNGFGNSGGLRLYHGTTISHATDIATNGIDLDRCRHLCDFGQAFYTAVDASIALTYAVMQSIGEDAAVLVYEVSDENHQRLDTFSPNTTEWTALVTCTRRSMPRQLQRMNLQAYTRFQECDVVSGAITDNPTQIEAGNLAIQSNYQQMAFRSDMAVGALELVGVLRFSHPFGRNVEYFERQGR